MLENSISPDFNLLDTLGRIVLNSVNNVALFIKLEAWRFFRRDGYKV